MREKRTDLSYFITFPVNRFYCPWTSSIVWLGRKPSSRVKKWHLILSTLILLPVSTTAGDLRPPRSVQFSNANQTIPIYGCCISRWRDGSRRNMPVEVTI